MPSAPQQPRVRDEEVAHGAVVPVALDLVVRTVDELLDVAALWVEQLDAVVPPIRHIDVAVPVHGQGEVPDAAAVVTQAMTDCPAEMRERVPHTARAATRTVPTG